MKRATSWRLIVVILIAFLVAGYLRFIDRPGRRTFQSYVALNGKGPMGIADAPWDGADGVVLYRTGRNGVICYDGFHSKDLHDRLAAKNGQPVTVEYDTFSDFGKVNGYNVHSIDGMILANGTHLLRDDYAASAGSASEGAGSHGGDDCWWKILILFVLLTARI
jgi:hypothetical protein